MYVEQIYVKKGTNLGSYITTDAKVDTDKAQIKHSMVEIERCHISNLRP